MIRSVPICRVQRHHRSAFAITAGAVVVLTGAASVAPSPGATPAAATHRPAAVTGDATTDDARARVVVRPSRLQAVAGYVELEDDEVLVIRTPEGRLESFAKGRIFQLVRLLEVDAPLDVHVILRDGTTRSGLLLEDAFDFVRINIEGVEVSIPRDTVHLLRPQPSFEERYELVRRQLDRASPEAIIRFAQWLMDERRFDLAAAELTSLLEQVDSAPARRLLRTVELQLSLQRESEDRAARRARGEITQRPGFRDASHDQVLSDREVNLIRVFELDFARPPRVAVPRPTIQKLVTRFADSPLLPESELERLQLFRADPLDIVRLMFDLRARDLYGEIQVLSEPASLNFFRQRVHDAWLIPNCATSNCHGGDDAGRLALIGRNAREMRVRYTNLLILERTALDDPEWPLLNFARPRESLVIQHALPPARARRPHPRVPGWTPAIPHPDDARVTDFIEWLSLMHPDRGRYPVEFQPVPTPAWAARAAAADPPPSP